MKQKLYLYSLYAMLTLCVFGYSLFTLSLDFEDKQKKFSEVTSKLRELTNFLEKSKSYLLT